MGKYLTWLQVRGLRGKYQGRIQSAIQCQIPPKIRGHISSGPRFSPKQDTALVLPGLRTVPFQSRLIGTLNLAIQTSFISTPSLPKILTMPHAVIARINDDSEALHYKFIDLRFL